MDDDRDPPEEDDVDDRSSSAEAEDVGAPPDEPFVRYQNTFYRVITMVGAGLVLVLGLTGAVLSRTRDPRPPIQWMWIDLGVTVVLFTWYALGMRCRLDVAEGWVEVNTKYGTRRLARSEVASVEPDLSLWGSLQPAGRPLILHLVNGKRVKAPACLPSDRLGLENAIEELQGALGRPEERRQADLAESLERRLATMSPDEGAEVADSIRRRLEAMTPEGDASSGVHSDDPEAAAEAQADATSNLPIDQT